MSTDRLAAMETFLVVVDTGSFSAAARRLNVGQPAVSKLVAHPEERLGVKLLVRTTCAERQPILPAPANPPRPAN
jgi:DNA-binding transcriptional LysR family regulator